MENNKLQIKKPILAFFAVSLFIILGLSVFGTYCLQQQQFDQGVKRQLSSINKLFQATLDYEANHITSLINLCKIDEKLQDTFVKKDRNALLHKATPIFEYIRAQHGITHFYFHNPDKTCFLRVHNPQRHGDYIDRYTMQKAASLKTGYGGIELGPYGTFTLRVVHPWMVNNKLVGFVELGKEIENIAPQMKSIFAFDLFFLINKKFLDHEMWEQGQKMMHHNRSWDEVPGHVISGGTTMTNIPTELNKYMQLPHAEKEGLLFKFMTGDKKYRGGFTPLRDASGKEIGEIIALKDFSGEISKQSMTGILVLSSIVAAGFLLAFFYVYIGKTEKKVSRAYTTLENEVEHRKKVEDELKEYQENLEQLVQKRSHELIATNEQLKNEIEDRELIEKKLDVALKDRENIMETIPDILYTINTENKLIRWNKKAEDITGYSADELNNMNAFEFIAKEDQQRIGQALRDTAEKGYAESEGALLTKNGDKIPYHWTGAILKDENGDVLGITGVGRNISARKQIEQALTESHQRLHTVVDSLDAVVYVTDFDSNKILLMNNYARNVFGDGIGKECWKVLECKQTGPCDFCINSKLVSDDGKTLEMITWERKSSVNKRWYENHDRAIRWLDGSIVKLGIATDITERKLAEQELKNSKKELEKRVVQRTNELKKTYEQLLHAEKLSAVGKLSASIAHEFNNPICGIRNVLEGLNRKADLHEKNQKMIDLAIRECDRVSKLTADLQAFSRPSAGTVSPINIHKILDDLLLMSKKAFKAKKIRVEKHYSPDLPKIKAIPDQITQVFLNIFNNAGEAIQDNTGVITIRTEVFDKNIAISIQDSGTGIKPENMSQIYEPFFSTKPEVKGTGLGLAVTYGIIKRHGGRIDAESEPGKGAIFTVTLPIDGAIA